MSRLHFCLRLFAVAVAFPAILLYILAATLVRSISDYRSGLRTPLRIWMGVLDWAKRNPRGIQLLGALRGPGHA